MESREATPPPADLQRWQNALHEPLENDELDLFGVPSKYDFRIGAREKQNISLTDIDQDESGDYDPATERKRAIGTIHRKRRREMSERENNGVPKKQRIEAGIDCDLPVEWMEEDTCSVRAI